MVSLEIIAPILTSLVIMDLLLHVYLDLQKIRNVSSENVQESHEKIPRYATFSAAVATLVLFVIVAVLCICWIWSINLSSIPLFIFLYESPSPIWQIGFFLLCFGILLHGWSRLIRHDMATSWDMSDTQELVTSGPYRAIRHPSYASYMLCFLGLVVMLPSPLTLVLLLGIPGYYHVAKKEEQLLIYHFGDEYLSYMAKTGMFFPKLRIDED